MNSYQRMQLIGNEELARLRDRQLISYEPNLRAAAQTNEIIRTLVDDETLPAEERLALLHAQKLRIRKQMAAAKEAAGGPAVVASAAAAPAAAAPAAAVPVAVADVIRNATIERSVATVARNKREQARAMLNSLKDNPNVSFDDDMHVTIDGDPIEGSNLADIMHAMYNTYQTTLPAHTRDFAQALGSIHFPSTHIVNPNIKALITTSHPLGSPTHSSALTPGRIHHGKGRVLAAPAKFIKRKPPRKPRAATVMRLYK